MTNSYEDDPPGTLGIQEFADLCGVSTSSVRRWETRGLIPPAHRTPGGQRRYRREDVAKFIARPGGVTGNGAA